MKFRSLSLASLVVIGLLATPTEALAVIQSLNNQTGQTQTFQNDSNLTISSSSNTHSLGWLGLLPLSRGGTGANSFTNGSVLFSNGTFISQDNSNFFWDNTNNRLGIGTSIPSAILDVVGNVKISNSLTVSDGISSPHGEGLTLDGGDETSGDGGFVSLSAGNAIGNVGKGGGTSISGGYGGSVTGDGGNIDIESGAATGDGNGGQLSLSAGWGGESTGNGGDLTLQAGRAQGTGTNGNVQIINPTNFIGAIFDTSLLSTTNKIFAFPNFSGTFGLLEASQTWTGLNKFEASNNSTIYVGSSVKSGCIALGDSDGSGITYVTASDGALSASSTKPSICQ